MDDLPMFFENILTWDLTYLATWECDDFFREARKYLDMVEIESLLDTHFKDFFSARDKIFLSLRFRHAVKLFRCISDIDMAQGQQCHYEKKYIVGILQQYVREQERDCEVIRKRLENEIFSTPRDERTQLYECIFYKKLKLTKFNISQYLRKYIEKNNSVTTLGALRRGYARWKKTHAIQKKSQWPSLEFIRFFSMISVYFKTSSVCEGEPENVFLLKYEDPQLKSLWAKVKNLKYEKNFQNAKLEFEKLKRASQNLYSEKIQVLISQNNVYAIAREIAQGHFEKRKREKYEKMLALCDYENQRKRQNWNQNMLIPAFEPFYSFKRIRLIYNEYADYSNIIIPANSLVEKLEVFIAASDPSCNDDWAKCKKEKITWDDNTLKLTIRHPSMFDIDKLMKNKKSIQRISFIFLSDLSITVSNIIVGNPTILSSETIKELQDLDSYLKRFTHLPHKIKFSIDELKKLINAELTPPGRRNT